MMWIEKDTGKEIKEIKDMPFNVIGFTYLLEYANGKKYIGKKNLYYRTKLPKLKSKLKRKNHLSFLKDGKELVLKESNWLKYQGSHKERKQTPLRKYILKYAQSNRQLTYLETKELFNSNVLEDDSYFNDNILGKFFKGNIK